MRQYSWECRTDVLEDGVSKDLRIEQVSYDFNGQLQRVLLNDQSAPLPNGPFAQQLALRARQQVHQALIGLRGLLDQYTLPSSGKIASFLGQGTISPPDAGGLVQVTGSNVVMLGDTMSMWIDARTQLPRRLRIMTYYDGYQVTVTATFNTLPAGLNYMANAEINAPAVGMTLQVQNFDFVTTLPNNNPAFPPSQAQTPPPAPVPAPTPPPPPAPTPVPTPAPTFGLSTEILNARQQNARLMRQYFWSCRTEILENNMPKNTRIDIVRCGPDGQPYHTPLNDQANPLPRGFIRQRIAEREREKMETYLKDLRAFLHQYTLPTASPINSLIGNTTFSLPGPDGLLQISGGSVVVPADTVSLTISAATRHIRQMSVMTFFEGDEVTVNVTFKTLFGGLNYPAYIQISVPDKNLSVRIQNYDYVNQN